MENYSVFLWVNSQDIQAENKLLVHQLFPLNLSGSFYNTAMAMWGGDMEKIGKANKSSNGFVIVNNLASLCIHWYEYHG